MAAPPTPNVVNGASATSSRISIATFDTAKRLRESHSKLPDQAWPITTVSGLVGSEFPVAPVKPASLSIAVYSLKVYTLPAAVVASMVIAKAAAIGGDT